MIKKYLTATGATGASNNVFTGPIKKAIIQVNAALTGSIAVYDSNGGTASTSQIANITNPTVGSKYEYWGLSNGLQVVPSTTCDITASADISRPGAS